MQPPQEVDAGPFPHFPALPGQNAATIGLELSLALSSSEAPTPTHATNERDAAIASGLSREALEAALQLSYIKVENSDAAGAAVVAAAFSGSAACSPTRSSGATSGPSLRLAATRLLGATPLHPLAVSAGSGLAKSLAAAVTAASGPGVPLAGSPAPSLAGVTATQQPQGKKRGWPPKDPAELSNNPRSKQQREYQHGLASKKRKAERLKRNDRAARFHARKAIKKTDDWLKALAEKRLELEQVKEDEVVHARYVFSMWYFYFAAKFLPYRDASRNSANALVAPKEAIARIAQFIAASQEEKNWEDVEAYDDVEDSMLIRRGNNLSGFRMPAPPPDTPDAKTAIKAMLTGPVIPERERHWRKWKSWFRAVVRSLQQQPIGDMCPTTWSPWERVLWSFGASVTENEDDEAQDFPGEASINKNGCLDGQLFIDTSPAFQRLANDVAHVFYAKEMLHDFARVLQRLKNSFGFNEI